MNIKFLQRMRLNDISQELYGASSRWYKLYNYIGVPLDKFETMLEEELNIKQQGFSCMKELSTKVFKDENKWREECRNLGLLNCQMKILLENIIRDGDKISQDAITKANVALTNNSASNENSSDR